MLLWLYRIFLAVFLVFPGSAAVATPSGATDVLLQFRKICPTQAQPMLSMLGKYSPGEPDAFTLRDALGDIPREALIDRLNSLLGFTDRFGASSRWDRQIEVCSDAQLSEGHTSGCLDLDDTVDWFVLQTAIFSAPAGTTLTIDRNAIGHLAINQSLALPAGTTVEWRPDAEGSYSYLYNVGSTAAIGGMITSYNPYGRHVDTLLGNVVADLALVEPHIDGNNIPGENAVGFARGTRDIRIVGGKIRKFRFDPVRQGGRAIQCEDGCENLLVKGTTITDTAFGISSTALHKRVDVYLPPDGKEMMLSAVQAVDIVMERVEVPFSFLNAKFGGSTLEDRQSVLINGAMLRDVGALTTSQFPNHDITYFAFPNPSTGEMAWCINRTNLVEAAYQTNGDTRNSDGAGVFFFQGGRNIQIDNVTIENSSDYPVIGGIFRGEVAAHVRVSNISFSGRANAVFNFTGGIGGPTAPAAHFEDAVFSGIKVRGEIKGVSIDVTEIPYRRPRMTSQGYRCTPPQSNNGKLDDVRFEIN